MRKLAFILIILGLSATIGEASEDNLNFSKTSKLTNVEKVLTTGSFSLSNDCKDCETNHCQEAGAHCSHHCSGIHNISLQENQVQLGLDNSQNDKKLWYFNSHYRTPFLEPAKKPPLFS